MLLKTDGYYCEMGWEGKGGAAGQGQDGRAASQLSRRNLWVPGEAENNLNTAAQNNMFGTGLQQHSLTVAQHWQGNRAQCLLCSLCCLRALLCLWSCHPGPLSPVVRVRDSLRGLGQHLLQSSSPLLQGLHLTVPGCRAFHHKKICIDTEQMSRSTQSGN